MNVDFLNFYHRPITLLKWQVEKYNPLFQKVYKNPSFNQNALIFKKYAFWVRQSIKFIFTLQAPNETFHHFSRLTEK